jgi:hypothetical protein
LGRMAWREQGACTRRQWEIAQNFPINDFSGSKIDASVAELEEEKKCRDISHARARTPARHPLSRKGIPRGAT